MSSNQIVNKNIVNHYIKSVIKKENHDNWRNDTLPFSAFRSTDYGYTRMQAYNSSHLYLEQVSDDKVLNKIMNKSRT